MKHYFIFNPIAGNKVKRELFFELYNKLEQNGEDEYILYQSKERGDATKYVSQIATLNEPNDICVYACGGDGTTNEVMNGMAEHSNVILGIVPTGSCNDFLKNFPEYDFLDLKKQIRGEAKPIDVMKVDDLYCLNVTNIGFDAKVNYDQIQYRPKFKTIKKAYNYAIFRNIIRPLGEEMSVLVDGQPFYDGKSLLIAIGNGQYYGGGYRCTPSALVDDGILNIILVKKVTIFTFLSLLKKYKNGELDHNPKFTKVVKIGKGKVINIKAPEIMTVCVDGETIHKKEITINTLQKQIRFKFPSKE